MAKQREQDLNAIITDEKLKPEETRRFLENAFHEGEIRTSGTDIEKIMPPVSRFGGGGKTQKKQGVIEKLKIFFEKYFGVGGTAKFTEEEEEKVIEYDFGSKSVEWAAEDKGEYSLNKDRRIE